MASGDLKEAWVARISVATSIALWSMGTTITSAEPKNVS